MTSPDIPISAQKPRRFTNLLLQTKEILSPSQQAWRGAARVLLGGFSLMLALSVGWILWAGGPVRTIVGILVMLLVVAVVAALAALVIALPGRLPFFYRMALATSLTVTVLLGWLGLVYLIGILVTAAALVIGLSLIGAGAHVVRLPRPQPDQPVTARLRRAFAFIGMVVGVILVGITLAWLVYPGTPLERPIIPASERASGLPMDMPDPSKPGQYPVAVLCYGSQGSEQIGPCQEPLDVETQPVDGSAFVEGWSSLRRSYWGFGPEAMPLNAIVWYPEGQGPFPLVLIVHGNAFMEKPSQGGYAYLGELLASRGFVVASIDQNFLNLSFFSDLFILNKLEEENDARGWLLLEHLRLWHTWNDDSTSPFYGLADLERIALIGHSRGGEAVVVAAAFNRLPYYPDDARVAFDYNYSIQSVAAIAPIDGQYSPGGVGTAIQDVSYLAMQGAHDMDVISYHAARQYERVSFSGNVFKFKAGLYIDGANHGQFNTAWGRKDMTEPLARFFNLRQIMPVDEQRQIARVYLTAFLEATLNGQRGYLPLFRDARAGASWLPLGLYLNQYADSNTQLISDFEEDIDPSTTSLDGGAIQGQNLSVWYEKPMPARWGSSENRVAYLGWQEEEDSGVEAWPASYITTLPSTLAPNHGSVLVLSLAGTDEDPCPDEACRKARPETYRPTESFDLTVEVSDRNGQIARLPLSSYAALRPPLVTKLAKSPFRIVLPESEIVLKHFEFPLADFVAENPAFNIKALSSVRLVFDRTPEGVIVLDQLGLRED